ncbi:homeobox protein knotted-1-like 3 isoform X5 [Arachis hypogaea]|uniref:Homeobox protein knotted-1-like 3 n=2 Tax=Arachis hypogaea TaxID=3818 RepID=A0A444YVA1_ARAHY|nr:homeobox protein knotted-1-like 3 isoform X1 [Arachis hypogaea]RYR05814.1 hypothetical protein Ahy_B06g085633 isoform B [Arachis hypogaea]
MAYHNHNPLSVSDSHDDLPLHHFTHQSNTFPSSPPHPNSKPNSDPLQTTAPSWLNNALLRTNFTDTTNTTATSNANNTNANSNFLNLHTASDSAASQPSPWLDATGVNFEPVDLKTGIANAKGDVAAAVVGDGGGGDGGGGGMVNWQVGRWKAEILAHPLYEQLLSAHVACLRIATPVDQLPRIDAQLAQSQNVVSKYSAFGHGVGDDKELDQFMVTLPLTVSKSTSHYVLLLCSFKEQLQQHVRVHAMEAVMACWEIEQSLQSLTGVSPGEGTGATMSDDEDDQVDSEANLFDGSLDGTDSMGFGPLIPTENERSLMERVRQELKHELKNGYKEKIVDIREEILRKRRAGKLPGDTTSVLKAWWQSHSKWPYPTEEDKARLVQETGLQLKQINNWFINQRKRNWHSNPSSSTVLKSKRKRNNAGDNNADRYM